MYHLLKVSNNAVFTHLRLNMFPDGGMARIRTFGIVSKPSNPERIIRYRINKEWPELDYPDENLVDLGRML
jgi:allantoicase